MGIAAKHFYRFDYLKSEHWSDLRFKKLAQKEAMCQVCGIQNWDNDVHHVHYKKLWDVTIDDLAVLCRKCHSDVHDALAKYPYLKKLPLNGDRMINHIRFHILKVGVTR